MPRTLGLYLHIPFCLQKCSYCDFCSAPANEDTRTAYVDALCTHLRAAAPQAAAYRVDTVYLGGGTPTLLSPSDFSHILDTVRAHFDLMPDAEITAECNPATNTSGLLEGLVQSGINRLSIGLQSIHERELRALGRLHDFEVFRTTLANARQAGLSNISVDVMFGIPHQTPSTLRETLHTLCDLAPAHISAYGLRVEEGTPFWQMRDTLPLPDEDTEAEMAELVSTLLPARGYVRYEISNYARPGRESRHNLRYWLGEDYLGFGPAAHSFFDGVRFSTPPDTKGYIKAVREGRYGDLVTAQQRIDAHEAREEYVMLRMRLSRGIEKADFLHRFGISFEGCYGDLTPLVRGGFLINDDAHVAFTARGMQLSNAILSQWLDFGGAK